MQPWLRELLRNSKLLRLPCEADLQSQLLDTATILEKIKKLKNDSMATQQTLFFHLYSKGLKLNKSRAPDIVKIVENAVDVLSISAEISVFVLRGHGSLASVQRVADNHYVIVTDPSLFDLFNLDELSFVFGHELGHVKFDHFDLKGLDLEGLHSRMVLKFFEHSRLAELSADRAGLLCCGSFEVAFAALSKLGSGTRSSLIKPNRIADAIQVNDLRDILEDKQSLLEARLSHPYSILRLEGLRILQKKLPAKSIAISTEGLEKLMHCIDSEIDELLNIITPASSTKEDWLLVLGGFMVAFSNEEFNLSERKEVAKLCSGKEFSDLASLCRNHDSPADLMEEMFISEYQAIKLSAPKKAMLVERLVAVAKADGNIDSHELKALNAICEIIEIDASFMEHLLSSTVEAS